MTRGKADNGQQPYSFAHVGLEEHLAQTDHMERLQASFTAVTPILGAAQKCHSPDRADCQLQGGYGAWAWKPEINKEVTGSGEAEKHTLPRQRGSTGEDTGRCLGREMDQPV
ncbi:UNVERIFIED_CONTAM: hypothetical protein K2H54_006167 [Gekko kuhli]